VYPVPVIIIKIINRKLNLFWKTTLVMTKISANKFNVGGAAMLIIKIKNQNKERPLEETKSPFVINKLRE